MTRLKIFRRNRNTVLYLLKYWRTIKTKFLSTCTNLIMLTIVRWKSRNVSDFYQIRHSADDNSQHQKPKKVDDHSPQLMAKMWTDWQVDNNAKRGTVKLHILLSTSVIFLYSGYFHLKTWFLIVQSKL